MVWSMIFLKGMTWAKRDLYLKMVPPVRFELTTSPLPREYSTPELRRLNKARRTMPPAGEMSTASGTDPRYNEDMSDKIKLSRDKQAERREREAAALRENLRRRKAQSQAREEDRLKTDEG